MIKINEQNHLQFLVLQVQAPLTILYPFLQVVQPAGPAKVQALQETSQAKQMVVVP